MADKSTIEWTGATWNPITGCSIVSPGCTNCYAMKLAGGRLKHHPSRAGLTMPSKAGPVWNGKVRLNEQWLDQPLRWSRPRMIFVCAHGDLFHEDVPDEWIDRVFAVMALAPQHTFQVLTKRSARMREYVSRANDQWNGNAENFADRFQAAMDWNYAWINEIDDMPWPLPNVWLGVSAERQKEADERIPDLLAMPAAIRFVSAEPLLGPINITDAMWAGDGAATDNLSSTLDWIIVGGESGLNARPMHPAWARSIRDQCEATGTAFFFKQWGGWHPHGQQLSDGIFNALGNPDDQARWHSFGDGETAWNVGKKDAGRLLDGIEHNGMPQGREVEAL